MSFGSWVRHWLGSGYEGAESSDARPSAAMGRSQPVDEDRAVTKWGRQRLILEASDMRRNNPFAAALGGAFVDGVVGEKGVTPQARTRDESWNSAAESFFAEWSKVADSRQIANMREMQAAAINARLFFGDIGFVITDGGQLQPIEGQCINTPQDLVSDDLITDGVRLNANGIRTAYYVTRRDRRSGRADVSKYEAVNAADMIFCRAPSWRVDQVRGIPEIAPVIPLLHDINDLQQRMLERARAEASNIAVITSEEGAARGQMLGDRGARGKDTAQVSQPVEHIGRRKTHYLRTGETLQIPDITAPGADHVTYRKALLESVAATLRLPAQFVSLVFDSSFSGGRLGPILAHHTFAQWETWLVDSMLQRTWNWRIAKAIKDGDLPPAPVDERGISEWYKVEWFGQAHEWIDPQAQAAAEREAFRLGTVSMTDIVKKKSGRDFATVLKTKGRDIGEAVTLAKELTQSLGVEIKWTDLVDVSTSVSKSTEAQKDNSQEFENTEGLGKWLK